MRQISCGTVGTGVAYTILDQQFESCRLGRAFIGIMNECQRTNSKKEKNDEK